MFYAVSAIFLALNFYLLLTRDSLAAVALPGALAFALLAFFRLDLLLFVIVFFTPLSLPLKEIVPGLSFDMNLPTEPLLFGVLLYFVLRVAQKQDLSKKFLYHPVSLVLLFYLGWMLLTSLTSTMPVVSLKYWLSKVWFIVAFYVLGFGLMQKESNFYRFIWLYCLGFVPVILYAWWRQSSYGFFDNQAANYVMNPFYKDHTSYGAMLVFFMPALIALYLQKRTSKWTRFAVGLLGLIFVVALVLSYTRAAWLSLGIALGVLPLLYFKVRFRMVVLAITMTIGVIWGFQERISERLATNKQESSSELSGHINSISNVTTDASNVERLNRWSSAIAMFQEKPVFGWGPGTYMFQYAPFQRTDLRTIISTNSGDGGNAHSEYLGPLSESGLPGLAGVVALFLVILATGFRVYERAETTEHRRIVAAILIALISYFVHGVLNNFLDTDKAAIPVWTFAVMLVVLDLKQKRPSRFD